MHGFRPLVALAFVACATLPPSEPPTDTAQSGNVAVIVEKTPPLEPIMTRRENVVETVHGQKVEDPYRWLEQSDSAEVKSWVDNQNRHLEAALGALPARAKLRERLETLLEIGEVSLPSVRRTKSKKLRYFFTRRQGEENQPRLLVRDGLEGKDRPLIDPNQMSSDGTTSLDWYVPSPDGALLAYGTSEGGSEESVLRIRDVATGQDLADRITRARYSSVAWLPGNQRFYYARFPAPGSVPKGEEKYHRTIFQHDIGTDPEKDPVVFASQEMTDFPSAAISPNGRWLVVRVHQGWSKSSLWLADTSQPKLTFKLLTTNLNQVYDPIPHDDVLWIRTNEGASRYALWAANPLHPERQSWKRVVDQHPEDVLVDVAVVNHQLLVTYMHQVVARLERFDEKGKSLGQVELPTLGSCSGFTGLHDDSQAFFDFESFVTPPSIRRIELGSGKVSTWQKVDAPIPTDEFTVTPGHAKSKDGTSVPYLLVHRKNVALDNGDNPTLLYGYGGFNLSLLPRFSRATYAFLEKGGVYVQANLRGGGEFGEDWHRAGQLEKKQNVFDDFIAVAEKLVADKVTRPERLAIYGRSNGGLLVAAAITQRPELFRAAVSGVPLTDMVRYDRFQIAKLWIPEYGTPENAKQFRFLYAYSPYHHVKPATPYPAVLLMTAESDTRVDPMHARKMAAALQYAQTVDRPILLRSEDKAGHGAGKPISKTAEEYADIYAFVLWQLGAL